MKDEIKLETWRKYIDSLKKNYKNIKELREDTKKKCKNHHVIMIYDDRGIVGVYPGQGVDQYGEHADDRVHTMRDVKWYYIRKTTLRQLDIEKMIDELVEKFRDKLSVDKILRDALYDTNPEDLNEMFERAVIKKGKVKEKEGCYKLIIGGKRGSPMEFMVRE